MARAGTTYRAYRRNRCLKVDKGIWPAGGVQLDPVHYRPTSDYVSDMQGTTPEMFAAGRKWIREIGKFGRKKSA